MGQVAESELIGVVSYVQCFLLRLLCFLSRFLFPFLASVF